MNARMLLKLSRKSPIRYAESAKRAIILPKISPMGERLASQRVLPYSQTFSAMQGISDYNYTNVRCLSTNRARGKAEGEAWGRNKTPYEILGVSKNADEKQIKLAYFKAAREHHPDTNPDDPEGARERFQFVAAAYEILSDRTKRRDYDAQAATGGFGAGFSGRGGGATNRQQRAAASDWRARQQEAGGFGATRQQQSWYTNTSSYTDYAYASQMFSYITQEDIDVIKEAISAYEEDLKEDLVEAAQLVSEGQIGQAATLMAEHKYLFAGVVLPAAVLLRFPGLIMGTVVVFFRFGRVIAGAVNVILAVLYETGLGARLWKRVVSRARRRLERMPGRGRGKHGRRE